jgi:phosphatidylserine decarboxylase
VSVGGKLILGALEVLPEKHLSRAVRALAATPAQFAVRRFAAAYGIDVSEAEHPLDAYPSVLAFFTRRLKPGARPLDPDPRAFLSPVDGVLDVTGPVTADRIVQAKGRDYSVAALLASPELAARYEGGSFATIYLSPRDYHRTHSPVEGRVVEATYVPGALMPVNPNAVAHVDGLFARNERLVTVIDTEHFGRVAYVMVGATCVGHMKVAYDESIATNTGGASLDRRVYSPPVPIARGGELGVFELGSTVVVLVERHVRLTTPAGTAVRMGQAIGHR